MEAKGTRQLNAIIHTRLDPGRMLRRTLLGSLTKLNPRGKGKSHINFKFSEVATVRWFHEAISSLWKYSLRYFGVKGHDMCHLFSNTYI